MVRSLLSAKTWLENYNCIISYSDIIYSNSAVEKLINCEGDLSISFDPNWKNLWEKRFESPLCDAETFKINNSGILTEIGGKAQTINEIEGQYMGLIKITPKGVENYKINFEKI